MALLAVAGVAAVLAGAAAYSEAPTLTQYYRENRTTDPTKEQEYADVGRVNDPSVRVARRLRVLRENGLNGAHMGLSDPDIRTNFSSLRSTGRVGIDPQPVMEAFAVAQQYSKQSEWDHMLQMPQQKVSSDQAFGVQNMNFLVDNELVGRYPFAHANHKPGESEMYQAAVQSQGPIDNNNYLWLMRPYDMANPFMPASRTRNPASNAFHERKDSAADTMRLIPRGGYKKKRTVRPQMQVHFQEAPPLAQ